MIIRRTSKVVHVNSNFAAHLPALRRPSFFPTHIQGRFPNETKGFKPHERPAVEEDVEAEGAR